MLKINPRNSLVRIDEALTRGVSDLPYAVVGLERWRDHVRNSNPAKYSNPTKTRDYSLRRDYRRILLRVVIPLRLGIREFIGL